MAKLRFTKPGESKDKKRFKRNVKVKKYSNRLFIIALCIYVIYKEQLIETIKRLLQ